MSNTQSAGGAVSTPWPAPSISPGDERGRLRIAARRRRRTTDAGRCSAESAIVKDVRAGFGHGSPPAHPCTTIDTMPTRP